MATEKAHDRVGCTAAVVCMFGGKSREMRGQEALYGRCDTNLSLCSLQGGGVWFALRLPTGRPRARRQACHSVPQHTWHDSSGSPKCFMYLTTSITSPPSQPWPYLCLVGWVGGGGGGGWGGVVSGWGVGGGVGWGVGGASAGAEGKGHVKGRRPGSRAGTVTCRQVLSRGRREQEV